LEQFSERSINTQVRELSMYSRFVVILKFLQLLGYIGALILAGIYAKVYAFWLSEINDKVFLD
jgi:hypothetical protein